MMPPGRHFGIVITLSIAASSICFAFCRSNKSADEVMLPPMANLCPQDRMAWKRILRWPDLLDIQDDHSHTAAMRFLEIDSKRHVAEIEISSGNGYNDCIYYLIDQTTSPVSTEPLYFPVRSEDGKITFEFELLGKADWEREERILTVFKKGGAGSDVAYHYQSRYLIDPPRVELLTVRAKTCVLVQNGETVSDWPLVYESKQSH